MNKGKVEFWSSTEYSGFLVGLMRELKALGLDARQRYHISEGSYRSAKSGMARLWLRFRQYVAYPIQLVAALAWRRVRVESESESGDQLGEEGSTELKTEELGTGKLRPKGVCVVSTNTFYAPLIATYLHPNVVHLVYDLFPEAMIHSGKWREGTLKVRVVRWVVGRTLRRAKTNVFLGARLKDYVESIHGAVDNAVIIPVGADQSLFRLSPKQRLSESDPASPSESDPTSFQYATGLSSSKSETGSESEGLKVGKSEGLSQTQSKIKNRKSEIQSAPTVLYCGNLGNMHDTDTLFAFWRKVGTHVAMRQPQASQSQETATQLDPMLTAQESRTAEGSRPYLSWHFNCSGPKRAELEEVVAGLPEGVQSSICVGDGLSQAEWIERMEASEVALVTMAPGAEQVVMPSKTYSAMMAGQALLVIAPEDSDLVDLVKSVDCGWWVRPGDVDALGAVLRELADDAALVLEKRERAFKYAHEHFGQNHIAGAWQALVEKL